MDIENVFEGIELPEDAKTKLTGKLESFKSQIDSSYTTKLEESDNKLKEAIESRDKTKARIKDYEEKIKKGDFDGARELKELNEKLSKDLEGYETTVNEHKSKYEKLEKDFKAKSEMFDKFVKAQKDEILEKIPEKLKSSAEKLGLEDLRNFHKGLVEEQIIVDKTLHPGNNKGEKAKTLAEWKAKYNMMK
jgi:hypothetical protein